MTRKTGFSLLEVLFAIFIAGLLAMTVGYSLILSLRGEGRNRALQEATLVADSLSCGYLLGLPSEATTSLLPPHWQAVPDQEPQDAGSTQAVWTVTNISFPPADFRARIAWRANLEQIERITP